MRQSEIVIFRASPDVVEVLSRAAEAEGLSKSETLRRAVKEMATA